jgi:hypothetical protein
MAWILLAALAAQGAPASVYTALDLDRCRVTAQVEEGESVTQECPGHMTIPLIVSQGDGRFDIDAGADNEVWESLGPFNYPGPRVEWRMRGREVMAIIFRLISAAPERPGYSALLVETIGRAGRPGCLIARIDGRRADANEAARAVADARAATFRCGLDRPEPIEGD